MPYARGLALTMTRAALVLLLATAAACGGRASAEASGWRPPADSEIPTDSLGAAIRRGLALVMNTTDSLPAFAPGFISCTNCHLGGGRVLDASPLTGAFVRYPKYMDRSGAVVGIADRVNYCFTRSLAGSRLPHESREMQDIVAYLAWLSRGVAVGEGNSTPGADGLPPLPAGLTADRARGEQVYLAKCVSCHLPSGDGNRGAVPAVPALWGPKSFSIGASMARQSKAASFIWHNMPWGMPRTLTQQEAVDVAAYVTAQPRPDSPGKEGDWPGGGAPADVPYTTTGHKAFMPPPVLPRANAAAALVPAPRSIRKK